MDSREVHCGGRAKLSFIEEEGLEVFGGGVGCEMEDSAHEPLAEGGRSTGYWILIPDSTAGRVVAWDAEAGLDTDRGRSRSDE